MIMRKVDENEWFKTYRLSPREIDVLACMLENQASKKICQILDIKQKTADAHVIHIMQKMGKNSRSSIIDFVKKSPSAPEIKKHYIDLLQTFEFREALLKIKKSTMYTRIFCKLDCANEAVKKRLAGDLQQLNIFCFERKKEAPIISVNLQESYYLTFFNLLNQLIPHQVIEQIIDEWTIHFNDMGNMYQSQILGFSGEPRDQINLLYFWKKFRGIKGSLLLLLAVIFIFCGYIITTQFSFSPTSARSDFYVPSQYLQRKVILTKIDNLYFTDKSPIKKIALVGIGGAGKTTIARQYAQMETSALVWEVNAETQAALLDSFTQLAYALSKTQEEKVELEHIKKSNNQRDHAQKLMYFVKQKIKKYKNWLLVFDNVETLTNIKAFLPTDQTTWGNGKILITTRNSNIRDCGFVSATHIIPVGELTQQEKFDLFSRIQGKLAPNKEQLPMFLKKIPPFPLDVSIAAYYIKRTSHSYSEYLDKLKDLTPEDMSGYSQTRYQIITSSIEQIIKNHEFLGLLLLISVIDSQNIPKDLLKKYGDNFVVEDFIHHMKLFSLLSEKYDRIQNSASLFIHRSTQDLILQYILNNFSDQVKQELYSKSAESLYRYADQILEEEDFQKIRTLLPHLQNFIKYKQFCITASYQIMLQIGCCYDRLRDYLYAQPFLITSADFFKAQSIPYKKCHQFLPKALANLGANYHHIGHWKQAKEACAESINLYTKFFHEQQMELAHALITQSWASSECGDSAGAIHALNQCISIYKKHLGSNCIQVATCFFRIGGTYLKMGDTTRAKYYCEKSLEMFRKIGKKTEEQIARVLARIGNIYQLEGNYLKALKYLEEACYDSNKYANKNQNAQLVWGVSYLCETYVHLGLYKKAEALTRWLIHYAEQCYGKNSTYAAWFLMILGLLEIDLDHHKTAQQILEKSVDIHNKQRGENHILSIRVKSALAKSYSELRRFEEAEKLYKHCLLIYKKQYGDTHTAYAELLCDIAHMYILKKDFSTAHMILNKALPILQQKKHAQTYRCYEYLGDLYEAQKQYDKAKDFYGKSWILTRRYLPKNSAHIARLKVKIPLKVRCILYIKSFFTMVSPRLHVNSFA